MFKKSGYIGTMAIVVFILVSDIIVLKWAGINCHDFLKLKTLESLSEIEMNEKYEPALVENINTEFYESVFKIGNYKLKQVEATTKPVQAKDDQTIISPKLASRAISTSAAKQVTITGMWPLNGMLTSSFGNRLGKMHKGIDIAAKTGTDVHAFMGGTVIYSGWENGGYGYLIIINHGNGLESYYGHNSKLFVQKEQVINKGQHIADVGSTGDSTGPHSHFEVRKDGVPVNPLIYLK